MRPGRANGHLMVGTTDHQAVLDVADHLGRNGRQVTYVDVAPQGTACPGAIDPQMFSELLQSDTFLVSLLLANNEIGVIHPTAVSIIRRPVEPSHDIELGFLGVALQ